MSDGGNAGARRRWVGLALKGLFALLASVLALWWALHDVDLADVSEKLKASSVGVVLGVFTLQLALHGVRVVRWGLLVKPLGAVSHRAIFSAASLGFPATFFIPLRLGELVRPALISRQGVPFAGAMASVVVERIADGVTGLGLFFFLLTVLPDDAQVPEQLRTFSVIALAIFGGALVGLVAAVFAKRPALAIIRRILGPISESLAEKVVALLEAFIHGATVLRTPGRIASFVGLSLAFWLVTGLAMWILADSYIPTVPLMLGPFVTSVTVFATMIPAGPAFAGTLEAGFRFGMAPFKITPEAAAVVAIAFHVIQVALMAVVAGLGFLTADARAQAAAAQPAPVEET